MSVGTIIAILRLLVWLVDTVYTAIESLTPEEKAQIKEAHTAWVEKCKELKDPMGGDGSGP